MGKNYELKRVEEEIWEQTPDHIQVKRRRFSFLRDEITKTKKKIDRHQKSIVKLKDELKEFETERNSLYPELVTFQTNNFPSVSSTLKKKNIESKYHYQWSINLTIGDIKRKKYLGTNKIVRERLDEINNDDRYTSKLRFNKDLEEYCREEIRKIIRTNIGKEMMSEKGKVDLYKKWRKNDLKMWDYFC